MKPVHRLADSGIKITILADQLIHSWLVNDHHSRIGISVVLVPEDDRKGPAKAQGSFFKSMSAFTLDFITNPPPNDQKITCIISDILNIWSLEIAKKTGLKLAVISPVSFPGLAARLKVPSLLEAVIIDEESCSKKNVEIILSPYLPVLRNHDLPWSVPWNIVWQKSCFQLLNAYEKFHKGSNWVIGNWFRDLDPCMDDLHPNLLSIGPLLDNSKPHGSPWQQDLSCLSWLDKQPHRSVVYAACGGTREKTRQQFDELAIGLQLVGKPFLWVVKSEPTDGAVTEYPDGLKEKASDSQGKMVQWAPQEQVLAHPSVASFLTHCGWSSIMESIINGIPMLCWPYFADHFYRRTCIYYRWEIGLEVKCWIV